VNRCFFHKTKHTSVDSSRNRGGQYNNGQNTEALKHDNTVPEKKAQSQQIKNIGISGRDTFNLINGIPKVTICSLSLNVAPSWLI